MTAIQPMRTGRLTADERRDAIVAAGMAEFAAHGLAGASTDAIARSAGVSQPYVFQLFGTKKELFLAVIRHAFFRTRASFEDAVRRYAAGETVTTAHGEECNSILDALGSAYVELLADRTLLMVQLQAYAAGADPDVQRVVRTEFGSMYGYVRRISGASPEEVHRFFAEGMLLNVGAAIGLAPDTTTWALERLGEEG